MTVPVVLTVEYTVHLLVGEGGMEQVKTGIDDDDVDTFASELLLCISNSRQSRKSRVK
jgi:hypothetical protein